MNAYRSELIEACRLLTDVLDVLPWSEDNDELADDITEFLDVTLSKLEAQQ